MDCCKVSGCTLDAVRPRSGMCEKHYRESVDRLARKCSVEGCDKAGNQGGGYCRTHKARFVKHGKTTNTRPRDWGSHSPHPLYQTWKSHRRATKDRNGKGLCSEWFNNFLAFADGVGSRPDNHTLRRKDLSKPLSPDNFYWKPSVSNKDRCEYQRNWRRVNPDKDWKNNQRKRFKRQGMTSSQLADLNARLDQLWERSGGKCDVCQKGEVSTDPRTNQPFRLAIDHSHKTGKLRGMLCVSCNTILGHFEKDPERVTKIIEYGRQHNAF